MILLARCSQPRRSGAEVDVVSARF